MADVKYDKCPKCGKEDISTPINKPDIRRCRDCFYKGPAEEFAAIKHVLSINNGVLGQKAKFN